jgi:flagellar protein FlgJ
MSTAPVNSQFYADPQGLGALRKDARTQGTAAIRETARQFEGLFTGMLLKSMRAATPKDSLMGSDQQDFYQDMFDQQMATHLSHGKGLGLADMLVQQLMRNAGDGPAVAAPPVAPAASAAPAANVWPPATRQEFINALMPAATEAGRKLGVDPKSLVAHAALETGWGKSMPRNADGSCSFNLFGIKAGSSWNGPRAQAATVEFTDGVARNQSASFRSYSSPQACLEDYAALLASKPRFGAALGTGADATAFAAGLQSGGYATDPNYVGKFGAVARQLHALAANTAASGSIA